MSETHPLRADNLPFTRDEHLDRILEEALTRAAQGRRLDVAELCGSRVELFEDVERLVRLVEATAVCRAEMRPAVAGYELLDEIGRGGMGVVYLARQQALGRLVALKVLPGFADPARSRARFLQEATVLARLRHPNVVTVYDVRVDGELCAYAMEYVEGCSLDALVAATRGVDREGAAEAVRARLDADAAVVGDGLTVFFTRIAAALASALAELHRAGVLHRDVKPSNVLVRRDGSPVLVDFGLVRAGAQPFETASGHFLGTPLFASPEQLQPGHGTLDARADVWGLGATLFHCLALRPPFAGGNVVEIARAQEVGSAPLLRTIDPRIPRDLETVVAKSLEIEPERRYQGAGELGRDLERVLRLDPVAARRRSWVERCARTVRRHARAASTIVASVAITLLVAGWWAAEQGRDARNRQAIDEHVRRAEEAILSEEICWQLWRADAERDRAPSSWTPAPRLDAALRELDAALALDPSHAEVAGFRAAVVAVETRIATRRLGSGVSSPDCDASVESGFASSPRWHGIHHFLLGELERALECWRIPGIDESENAFLAVVEGEVHREREEWPDAYTSLLRAAQRWPTVAFLAFDVADAALGLGSEREADRWLETSRRLGGVSRAARFRFEIDRARRRGDLELADALLREAARRGGGGVGLHRARARLCAARGDFAGEAAALRDAVVARPEWPHGWRNLADAAARWIDQAPAAERVRLWVAAASIGEGGDGRVLRFLARSKERWSAQAAPPESATASATRRSPGERLEALESLLHSLEIVSMSRSETFDTFEKRRLVGLAAWFAASWRDPSLSAAIAGAALRDAGAVASGLVRTAAVALGLAATGRSGLAQAPIWSEEGTTTFELGPVTGTLDDLDGDGVRELVCVQPHYDNDRGRVDVRSGASGVLLSTYTGEKAWDYFGGNADGAGDVDGDGVEDVVIGAPYFRDPITAALTGKVYVYSGATGLALFSRLGPSSGSLYGETVTGIGDVDGDGYDDIAVAAAGYDFWRGRVEVLSVAMDDCVYELDGEAQHNSYGRFAISGGPDVDGDGRPDLLIGAALWDKTSNQFDDHGRVYLHSGLDGTELHRWDGANPVDMFGWGVVWGGDVDGDGSRDVLIGAIRADGNPGDDRGRIYVYSGATWAEIGTIDGPQPNYDFGAWISCIGDVDGDGRDEIGVWAGPDGDGGPGSGRMIIYNGRTLRTMFEIDGSQDLEGFGQMIMRAEPLGDVNGDGVPDVATGGTLFDNQHGNDVGKVDVFALASLGLESSPAQPTAGDTLTLSTLGGVANALTVTVLVELDGIPTFRVFDGLATLDGFGERVISATVPPGVSGTVAVFRAYSVGLGRPGVARSPDEIVTIK